MLQKAFVFSSLLIALLLGVCTFFHIRLRSSDAAKYRKLVQESFEIRSRRTLEREPAHQMRKGVQKDIWVIRDGERLHLHIESEHSYLTIHQRKGKFDAIEELQHLQCRMQEEIDRTTFTQQVRTLIAQQGTYTYPSHRFTSQGVHLSFYRLPGIELPSSFPEIKPYLSGVAHEVVLGAATKIPTFTAYHLQAKLDPQQGFLP